MNFSSIHNKLYQFLLNKTDLIKNSEQKITSDNIYELFNLDAPPSDLNSETGMEYLTNLMNEFMELEAVLNLADSDKNGELTIEEKDKFLTDALNLNLDAKNLEKLFNQKTIEENEKDKIEPSNNASSSSGSNSSGSTGRSSGSSGSTGANKGSKTDSDDKRLQEAEKKMNDAEKKYTDSVKKDSEEVQKLETERSTISEEINTKQAELDTSKENVSTITSEISTIDGNLSTARSELEKLQGEKVADDDTEGKAKLETAIKEATTKVETLEAEKKTKETELEEANKKVTELTTELEEAKTKLAEIESKIAESASPETKSLLADFQAARSEYEKISAEVKAKKAAEQEAKKGEVNSEVRSLEDDPDFTGTETDFSKDKIYTTATGQQLTGEEVKENVENTLKELGVEGNITYMESSDGQIVVKEQGEGFENRYRIAPDGDVIGYKTAYGSFEEDGNTVYFNHSDKKGQDVKTSLPISDVESYIKNIKAGNSNGVNVESLLNTAMTFFDGSKHEGKRDHCVLYTSDVMAQYGFNVPTWSFDIYRKNEKVENGSVQPGDLYLSTNYASSMNQRDKYRHTGIVVSEMSMGGGEYCYITIDFAASGMSVNVHTTEDKPWFEYRKP